MSSRGIEIWTMQYPERPGQIMSESQREYTNSPWWWESVVDFDNAFDFNQQVRCKSIEDLINGHVYRMPMAQEVDFKLNHDPPCVVFSSMYRLEPNEHVQINYGIWGLSKQVIAVRGDIRIQHPHQFIPQDDYGNDISYQDFVVNFQNHFQYQEDTKMHFVLYYEVGSYDQISHDDQRVRRALDGYKVYQKMQEE